MNVSLSWFAQTPFSPATARRYGLLRCHLRSAPDGGDALILS